MEFIAGNLDFPAMIPPVDYPMAEEYAPARRKKSHRRPPSMITIESNELFLLSEFYRLFGEYLQDRHTPGKSAAVFAAHRKVSAFYSPGFGRNG